MESQQITLPEPPKIEQKETAEDKRKFAVLPINAIWDRRLNPFALRVLAALAAYANRAGITYVSNATLAEMLQTTRPRVTKAMGSIKKAGWVKQVGKPVLGVRGATLQILFSPDMALEDAIAIASAGTDEDLRTPEMKETELARMIVDNKKQWTEQELRDNKEKLAKMLLAAFKTPADQPRLYEPVQGDTQAVKKAKEAIRSRMRQLRAEQFKEQAKEKQKEVVSEQEHKHKKMCLGIETDTTQNTEQVHYLSEPVHKHGSNMGYEELVVYFEKHLFNGVKSESDLHICSLLAERGITVAELERYVTAYSGDTVTQLGKRILA